MAIFEKVLGTEYPDTAQSYGNIGTVYKKKCDYDKALEYFEKALRIFKSTLGDSHPNTQTVQKWIDETLAAIDARDDAR